jgi:hypothetical protein
MGKSFSECWAQATRYLSESEKAALLERVGQLRQEGMPQREAGMQAVDEAYKKTAADLAEVETAMTEGRTLYAPETPGEKAEAAAEVTRMQQIERDFPDLMVRMDGDDAAMPLSEFMARAKAEADELAADAPLMQIAAECALLNGA